MTFRRFHVIIVECEELNINRKGKCVNYQNVINEMMVRDVMQYFYRKFFSKSIFSGII